MTGEGEKRVRTGWNRTARVRRLRYPTVLVQAVQIYRFLTAVVQTVKTVTFITSSSFVILIQCRIWVMPFVYVKVIIEKQQIYLSLYYKVYKWRRRQQYHWYLYVNFNYSANAIKYNFTSHYYLFTVGQSDFSGTRLAPGTLRASFERTLLPAECRRRVWIRNDLPSREDPAETLRIN